MWRSRERIVATLQPNLTAVDTHHTIIFVGYLITVEQPHQKLENGVH